MTPWPGAGAPDPERVRYLVGIGCNVAPPRNVPAILEALARDHGALLCSRIYETPAVGPAPGGAFYNLAVALACEREAAALKSAFNALELALGRPRDDPTRRHVHLPADLDILYHARPAAPRPRHAAAVSTEPYYGRPVHELLQALDWGSGEAPQMVGRVVRVTLGGRTLGHEPSAVRYDPDEARPEVRPLAVGA